MIEWWYADNGQQIGPVDFDALTQLARSGKINADTLVWHQGMAGWQAIGTLQELRSLLQPQNVPVRQMPPAGMPTPPRGAGYTAPQQNMYAPERRQGMGTGLKVFIGVICAVFAIALLCVVVPIGAAVWKGYSEGKHAIEQRQAANLPPPPVAEPATPPASYAQPTAAGTATGQGWQNPLTQRSITVGTEWTVADATSSTGNARMAYQFSNQSSNAALKLIAEDNCLPMDVLIPNYKQRMGKDLAFIGEGDFSALQGQRMWEIDANIKAKPEVLMHVQLVRIDSRCWTMLSFRNGSEGSVDEITNALREKLWSTVF